MELKSIWATVTLLAVFGAWLWFDLKYKRQIDYIWYGYLLNATTGAKSEPRELLDAEKVFNVTEHYVEETNAMQRLYDLEYNINLVNALEIDQDYSNSRDLALSGWPVADQAKCSEQLDWIRNQLSQGENYALLKGQLGRELTQLMDSFGKPQSGLYRGLVTWTGSYEQCLQTNLNRGQIRTRYCWARMRPKWWPESVPVRPQPRIRVGVCLPETCDTLSLAASKQTIDWLIKLDLNQFQQDNLELDSMFCLPDERSPIRQISLTGRVYLVALFGWLIIVLVGSSAYELIRRRQRAALKRLPALEVRPTKQLSLLHLVAQKDKVVYQVAGQEQIDAVSSFWFALVKSLSIHNSIKSFKSNTFSSRISQGASAKPQVDLRCLNAAKFLMAVLIVLAHSLYLSGRFMRTNQIKIREATGTTSLIVMSIGRFVDTFFMLFGVLAAYTLSRKVKTDQLARPTVWLSYNLNVMLRLMPLIVPIYYYAKLISPFTSSGPWWDYGVYSWSLKGHCSREPWWKVIPYFGYLSGMPGVACQPVNWFLVVYSQLSLLIPLLVYVISKLPNHRARLTLVAYIFGVSSAFIAITMSGQTTFREESLTLYGGLQVDLMEKFESLGAMAALGRAGCVVIGCYVGYLLRRYEIEPEQKLPKWLRNKAALWAVLALNSILLLLPIIAQKIQHKTTLSEFISGYIVTGLMWNVLNALLIMLAVTEYNRTAIVRFFGHSFWHSANKLGFGIYLVHWEVLYRTVLGYEQGPSIGFMMDFYKLFAYGLFVSMSLSFLLHILIEAPVNALVEMIMCRSLLASVPTGANPKDELATKRVESV